ncbi:murein hydrolase activator EnvC family protein [Massilia litorea]|uniref:murein hydrolase activator EnvC family protein n=1 Tax=Massilia litorea TaxID=2769491 RepID=UPI0038B2EAA1
MRFPIKKLAVGTLLCGLLALSAAGTAAAAKPTERSRQKAAAEAQRAGIQQKLTALKKEISRTESEKDDAADTLAESEEAISNANRALRDLHQETVETNVRLQDLAGEQERLAQTIAGQKKQLSALLREHYVAGNEDRIKLLLSGDNPNRINRDLQMMAYVSQAQAKLLTALNANLAQVEANKEKVENAKVELEEIAEEQRDQKAVLEKEKARRAALLGELSSKLVVQRKQADSLQRDEQRMSGLVDQLTKLIREQAEAERKRQEALAAARAKAKLEAEAAAKARALARAAAKAERERLAREAAKAGKPAPKPLPPEPDEPKVAEQPKHEERTPDISLAPAAPAGAFASLRGRLTSPVSGTIAARFGAKRGGDGPSWKGMFIKAPEGTEVRSVAVGRVVHSGWMRGFGNLIIVDHGGDYLSIYANNQTLLKRLGDAVRAGEPIASAGNTGGNEESGLYFELRHLGKAFDPASWVKF